MTLERFNLLDGLIAAGILVADNEVYMLNQALPSTYSRFKYFCLFGNIVFSWVTVILSRKKTKKTLVVIDYGNTLYFHVFNGIDT